MNEQNALPTPDPKNPDHWRFAGGMIEGFTEFDAPKVVWEIAEKLDGVEDLAKIIHREYELAVRGDGKFQPWELAEFNQYKFLAAARALWADGWRKA